MQTCGMGFPVLYTGYNMNSEEIKSLDITSATDINKSDWVRGIVTCGRISCGGTV